jgi:phosphatidate cytidylyltransferase
VLKQRVITALIMLPVFLAGLFATSVFGFALFTGGIIAVAAWEWARLGGVEAQWQRCAYAALILLILVVLYPGPALPLLVLACFFWLGAAWLVMRWPAGRLQWEQSWVRLLAGLVLLPAAWASLLLMRNSHVNLLPDLPASLLVLYVFLIVWAADIGAYFSGKAWGRRKLAPAVSPGKSIEGALGGLLAVALLPLLLKILVDGLTFGNWFLLTLVSVVVAAISIIGDLFESLAKRSVGLKDSSQILPGHGGIMDRIDSVTAAAPIFAALAYLAGWLQPLATGAL